MNYPNLPGQSHRRPPRKSNFVLLLILGFMAFFLFTQYKKATVGAKPDGEVADFTIPDISNDDPHTMKRGLDQSARDRNGLRIGTAPTGNGDWEIETDVKLEDDDTNFVVGSGRGNPEARTNSGDWGIEVGASQESGGGTAVHTPPQAKTTKKDDWELGEVEVEKAE